MATRNRFGGIRDVLDISQPGHIFNQIVIEGKGKKRIDGIQASYASLTFNDDPDNLRLGRIAVIEGKIDENTFIDMNIDLASLGVGNVLLDLYTSGGSHRIITEGTLGILVEDEKPVSIIQFPMYYTGDSNGDPSPVMATLNVQGATIFNLDGTDNDYKIKLR